MQEEQGVWKALKLGQWQFRHECVDPHVQSRWAYGLFPRDLCDVGDVASFLDRRGYLAEKGAGRNCHDSP